MVITQDGDHGGMKSILRGWQSPQTRHCCNHLAEETSQLILATQLRLPQCIRSDHQDRCNETQQSECCTVATPNFNLGFYFNECFYGFCNTTITESHSFFGSDAAHRSNITPGREGLMKNTESHCRKCRTQCVPNKQGTKSQIQISASVASIFLLGFFFFKSVSFQIPYFMEATLNCWSSPWINHLCWITNNFNSRFT